MFKKLDYTCDGSVATITFNDEKTLNAIGSDVVVHFRAALEKAADEARCVIITGAGRGFSSGNNLSAKPKSDDEVERKFDGGEVLDTLYNPMIMEMKAHPTPIITAVNGAAAGVACSVALMGDIILASENAYFLQAFKRIGLVPDGGSTYLLPRMIGRARAMEMILLGEKLPAATALEWGLINRIYPADQLMEEANKLALSLAEGPTRALALSRDLIWQSADRTLEGQLYAERQAQRTAGLTKDFREGVSAFLEKRAAKFTGQ